MVKNKKLVKSHHYWIGIALGVLILGAIYFFLPKKAVTPEREREKVIEGNEMVMPEQDTYGNTTFGYEVSLPEGWVACERPSVAPVVRFHKSNDCSDWGDSYVAVSQESNIYYPKKLSPGQNLKDWIDGEIAANDSGLGVKIDFEEKLSETAYYVAKSDGKDNVYVVLPNKLVLIISPEKSGSDNEAQKVARKLSLSFRDEPVTTGDVTGLVVWRETEMNGFSNSSVYPNYHGDVLNPKTKQKVASFVADDSGVYLIRLLPGDYLLTFGETKKTIHVTAGQLTRIDDQAAPKP